MKINKNNYYLGTIANFKQAKKPKREPDFVSFTGRKRFLKDEEIFDGDLDADFYFSPPPMMKKQHIVFQVFMMLKDMMKK